MEALQYCLLFFLLGGLVGAGLHFLMMDAWVEAKLKELQAKVDTYESKQSK